MQTENLLETAFNAVGIKVKALLKLSKGLSFLLFSLGIESKSIAALEQSSTMSFILFLIFSSRSSG